jgi:GTP-binding protein
LTKPLKEVDFIGNARVRDSDWAVLSAGIKFLKSVASPEGLPPGEGPEIAFAGRSNAGKSSAINALVGRKRIAFVSKSPGRTQLINFFSFGAGQFLVDLPGYGYAAAPAPTRDNWDRLIGGYLQSRQPLCGVVLIMDVRHPLGKLDCEFLRWLAPTGVPVHILLSKADKLSRQQAAKALAQVQSGLHYDFPQCTVQLFSSTRGTGVAEARTAMIALLQRRAVHKKPPVKGE